MNTVIQEGIVSLQKGDLNNTIKQSETLARSVGSHPNEDIRAIAGMLVDAAGRLNAKMSLPIPAIPSKSISTPPDSKKKGANVRVRNLNNSLIPREKPNLSGMNNARKAALTRKQPTKMQPAPKVAEPLQPREPPKAQITTWKSPAPRQVNLLEKVKKPVEKSTVNFSKLFEARKSSLKGQTSDPKSIFNMPLPMEGPNPSSANNLMKSYKGQVGGKYNKTKKRNR